MNGLFETVVAYLRDEFYKPMAVRIKKLCLILTLAFPRGERNVVYSGDCCLEQIQWSGCEEILELDNVMKGVEKKEK